MGTAFSVRISRRTACLILITIFVGVSAVFAIGRYATRHLRVGRLIAAAAHGALYLDDRGVLRQHVSYDCGPASLAMILADKGHDLPENALLNDAHTNSRGTTMLNLQRAAQNAGVAASSWQLTYTDLQRIPKPVIAFVGNNHFIVVDNVTHFFVTVRDPAHGRLVYPAWIFSQYWQGKTIIFGDENLLRAAPNQASLENQRGAKE